MNPQQLNEYVRPILSPYLRGDYCLSEQGQKIVIEANSRLDESYAKANDLPIAGWCFDEIKNRLNQLPPAQYGTMLDVCTGTGFICLNVMGHGLFNKCVALDINPSALELLKKRAGQLRIEGIEVQAGNIFATQFPAESFDCIMGNAFLHHLPDNKSFFAEMFRILKPGGVICLTGEPTVSSVAWENFFQRLILGLMGKKQKPKGEVPLTDIWQFDQRTLTDLLKSVGFTEVKVSGFGRWSAAVHTLITRLWVRFTGHPAPAWVGFIAYFMRKMGEKISRTHSPDEMAGLTVAARKGVP